MNIQQWDGAVSMDNRTRLGRKNRLARAASRIFPIWIVLVCFFVCRPSLSAAESSEIVLKDVTVESGIEFVHTDGSSGRRFIVETVSAGLAVFDYDNDGDPDIYLVSGAPLPGAEAVDPPPRNALYRNDGGMRFTDVTQVSGTGDTGYGLGATAGDYDGDGDLDLYISNFGPNVLYRNNGDGTFTDVTAQAGVGNGDQVGAGVTFLDIDGDGDLDLYASNYVKFTFENHRIVRFNGIPAYVGPMDYMPSTDTLFLNNGDGTFRDVSAERGITAVPGTGMGITSCDYDNDGDTDIFVGNDVAGNFLWKNDGRGFFSEVGLESGLAYDFAGTAQGTMGADAGDFNNDGLLDFFVTSYQQDFATLFENLGGGFFEDITRQSGAGVGTLRHVTWGVNFADFDNDGLRDIFIACGHLHDNVEQFDTTAVYLAENIVMHNIGGRRFENISARCGDGLSPKRSSRGSACVDFDQDGDLDIIVLNSRSGVTLIRNDTKSDNHWLAIRLQGTAKNRFGIGSRVRVVCGEQSFYDEVINGRGYQGHGGSTLHFGLGTAGHVDFIEVHWHGGAVERFPCPGVDRLQVCSARGPEA